jgi:3,4-dihydroxy 2-butanone 4-phosphate synthase / GTP cyclohydrolase II
MYRPTPDAVAAALAELRGGATVLLRDGEGGGASGYLVCAAQAVAARQVNFMVREGRGLVCLALTAERCEELALARIPARGLAEPSKEFTVSIEAREGVTTGISAADRARTIAVACDPTSGPDDLRTPGHVFPLRARPGGLRERAGEAEAAVELMRLAGLRPAAVLCEVLGDDGHLARGVELARFEARHDLRSLSFPALLATSGREAARAGRFSAAA